MLESLIDRFSSESTSPYKIDNDERVSFIDRSVQNLTVNSIIEGDFPRENVIRQMAIKRVNKMLCIMLSVLIAVVIVSYYFVVSYEIKLNDLSRQTVVLNNENEELQNKLDTLKSFDNVDKTLQKNNMLQKAGKVIEASEITLNSQETPSKSTKKRIFKYAIGF